jgi:TIR domain/Pentapeptide repeats (8 copies)
MSKKGSISGRNRAHHKQLPNKTLHREKKRKIQIYETVVLGAENDEQLRDGEKGPRVRLPALDAGDYRITVELMGSKYVEGRSLKLVPNRSHLMALKRGAQSWNEWRRRNHNVRPNLRGASLPPGIDLYKADLSQADLTGATLERANLSRALLHSSKLVAANLKGANLHGAQLGHSDLSKANLADAELVAVTFTGAILAGTEFRNSLMGSTSLDAVNLSKAKGLSTIRHVGPSSIGTDTMHLSRASISETFLRGAGVPEAFITYAKSLVVNPVEYYSCFISYSSKDEEFAKRLHRDLQGEHVRCWFAPHDVQGGQKLHEQIDRAIQLQDRVLLVLSPHSMNSEWVKTEIAKARKRELQETRHVLFPIRLTSFGAIRDWECFDADAGKDSAREIREFFIPDFSNWKDHGSYKKAFGRLLRDLKAGEKMPASRTGRD